MTLDTSSRFRANTAEVAASMMDGEVVFINLSTGVYYSSDNVGGLIWQLAEVGMSVEEIVETLAQRYLAPAHLVAGDVDAFLQQMVEEQIILPDARATRGAYQPEEGDPPHPYQTPVLQVYRDMSDLLALDAPMPTMEDIPWKGTKGGG